MPVRASEAGGDDRPWTTIDRTAMWFLFGAGLVSWIRKKMGEKAATPPEH